MLCLCCTQEKKTDTENEKKNSAYTYNNRNKHFMLTLERKEKIICKTTATTMAMGNDTNMTKEEERKNKK